MNKLTLTFSTEVGKNEFFQMRKDLNAFVAENFNLLFEGAVRLGLGIEADYYAPRRVQINQTRLHEGKGLKYAHSHKYSDAFAPTQEQLEKTVRDLEILLNAANAEVLAPFTLTIVAKGV